MSISFYPYKTLNYNTLNHPSTFTTYCFSDSNCPSIQQDYPKPDPEFDKMLENRYNIGLQRLKNYYQASDLDNLNNFPVYNTNMKPLNTVLMSSIFEVEAAVTDDFHVNPLIRLST